MKTALVAMVILLAAGTAAAEERGTLVVPVVGEHGVPVYCTYNLTPALAKPIDGGGYRMKLDHGRYVVRLKLPHETIDMLAAVPAGGEVIVPPVVARGRCRSIEVIARETETEDEVPAWAVEYGRSYSERAPVRKAEINWAPRYRHAPAKKVW